MDFEKLTRVRDSDPYNTFLIKIYSSFYQTAEQITLIFVAQLPLKTYLFTEKEF